MLECMLSRFDFELFETTQEDVEPISDAFVRCAHTPRRL